MGAIISMLIDWTFQALSGWRSPLAILFGPKKFQLPNQYWHEDMLLCRDHGLEHIQRVINLDLEPDDVIVASYPKAGTTLLQEIVWLVRNHADLDGAQQVPNLRRVPYIDIGVIDSLQIFRDLPRPRTIKTHVPWRMLPKGVLSGKNKIICPLRNPKDTLVSYYHFHRMNNLLGNFSGTWNDFFQYFEDHKYTLLYGNPLDHMQGYWEHKDDDNVLIVFYEELVLDRLNSVRKIAKFCEVELSEKQVEDVAKATGFEVMKSSPYTNYDLKPILPPGADWPLNNEISPFMRKGKVGDWKNWFNDEQNKIVDDMVERRLAASDLKHRFRYQ